MDNKEIASFSIEELRAKNPSAQGISHNGCFITLPEHMQNTATHTIFNYPCRINAHIILICTGGNTSLNIDLNEYRISENTIAIITPNNILQMEGSPNAIGAIVGFEERFVRYIDINLRGLLPLFLQLQGHPVLHIPPEECRRMQEIVRNMADEMEHSKDQPYYDEIIRSYFDLLIYKLGNIVSRNIKENRPVESSVKSRNEEYFQRFIHELTGNYKSERSVGFYASRLCITPKYLTTLIKKVSGRSAAEWIDNYVILEAKNLLRYSTMSIQEVAYYLNFPNQSFFGKYFKHQTGMSPSAYKMQKWGGETDGIDTDGGAKAVIRPGTGNE